MLCFVVSVLFGARAFAEQEVYRIKGTNNPIAGFYVQIDENSKIFQQLGGPDDKGFYTYLYNLPENPGVWNIGVGKNEENLKGFYTASGRNDEAPIQNWKSIKGEVKAFKVEKNPSLVSTLSETEANEGSATLDGGLICLMPNKIDWIMLTANDSKNCDGVVDCKNRLGKPRNKKNGKKR